MGSLTLAQASRLSQDLLVQGVAKEIITVDAFGGTLTFVPAKGKALVHDRELVAAGSSFNDIGGTVNATPGTVTQITSPIGRIVGDAHVDDFEQVTLSHQNDQMATQLLLKAKAIGRSWKGAIITGTGTFPQFTGVSNLNSATQLVEASSTTTGASLTFALLDELMDLITAKDGEVEWIIMQKTMIRKYKALVRTQGFTNNEVELGFLDPTTGQTGFKKILAYSDVPIFRNDYLSTESTNGATGKHRIFAGVYGKDFGLVGVSPGDNDTGIRISQEFISESKDANIRRLKMYTGLALYSTKGMAKLGNLASS